MAHPIWPLFDLAVRTPRLALRFVDDTLAVELALLAARGVHDPSTMPFLVPWTDETSPTLERATLQYYWSQRAAIGTQHWNLPLAAIADGAVAGTSSIAATNFAVAREFETGSWLGLAHQGRGLGRELREATLHLGFAGFGALAATSGAFTDNERSNRVSRGLGYRDNGMHSLERRGERSLIQHYRMERADWERVRRDDIVIEALEPCLELLGLSSSAGGPARRAGSGSPGAADRPPA